MHRKILFLLRRTEFTFVRRAASQGSRRTVDPRGRAPIGRSCAQSPRDGPVGACSASAAAGRGGRAVCGGSHPARSHPSKSKRGSARRAAPRHRLCCGRHVPLINWVWDMLNSLGAPAPSPGTDRLKLFSIPTTGRNIPNPVRSSPYLRSGFGLYLSRVSR